MDNIERQFYLKQANQRSSILDQMFNADSSRNVDLMKSLFDQKSSFYNDVMELKTTRKEKDSQNVTAQTININVSQAKKEINRAVKEIDQYLSKFF